MSDQNVQYAPTPPQESGQQNQPAPAPQAQPRRYTVPQGQNQQYLQNMQQQAESGLRFCRDCGKPVQPGSAVCVHCNYILNPEAFRQAQRLVGGRGRKPAAPTVQPRTRQAAQQPRQRVNPWADPGTRSRTGGSSYAQRQQASRRAGSSTGSALGDLITAVLQHYDILPGGTAQQDTGWRPTPTRTIPTPQQPVRPARPADPADLSMPSLEPTPQQSAPAAQAAQQQEQKQAPPSPEQIAAHSPDYHYDTSGAVYCPNCGAEVEHGAIQCIHCNYVIDYRQYQMAMTQAQKRAQLAEDRSAKLDRSDWIKSLLVPGYGRKMYNLHHERRPQIAEPCLKAGRINAVLLVLLIIIVGMIWGMMGELFF